MQKLHLKIESKVLILEPSRFIDIIFYWVICEISILNLKNAVLYSNIDSQSDKMKERFRRLCRRNQYVNYIDNQLGMVQNRCTLSLADSPF